MHPTDVNIGPDRVLASLPNGSVAIFDGDLRYVFAAGRGLEEVGLSAAGLMGKRLRDVFPAGAVDEVEPQYRRAFLGEAVVFSLACFHRVYSVSAAPYEIRDGQVCQILVVTQDITLLLPAAGAEPTPHDSDGDLRAQLDADERLIALLGHELRAPLSAMAGAIAVIQLSEQRSTREHAREVLQRQVSFVGSLRDTLLDVSRARRGVLPLQFEEVELVELLMQALEGIRHMAQPGKPSLRVAGASRVLIRADRQRLTQVVLNLVTNAVQHTPADGAVVITCARTREAIEISVRDSGSGLTAGEMQRLFQPFHRGTAEAGLGLGLGLWLAREIVLLHGGTIDAASDGSGAGATFTVRLPLALLVEQTH